MSRTHNVWISGDFLVLQSPESISNLFIIDCVWGNNCLIADVYGCIIYKQSGEDVTINKVLQWPMRILMIRQPSSGNNKLHRNTNNNYNYWIVTLLPFEPLPTVLIFLELFSNIFQLKIVSLSLIIWLNIWDRKGGGVNPPPH